MCICYIQLAVANIQLAVAKHLISFTVAPTEALFIASPPAFDGLHDDIKLFVVRHLYQKLLKKLL